MSHRDVAGLRVAGVVLEQTRQRLEQGRLRMGSRTRAVDFDAVQRERSKPGGWGKQITVVGQNVEQARKNG